MSAQTRAAVGDLPPVPAQPEMVLRAFAYWRAQYRRTWRGSAISTVLEPLGFLAAMGMGLGLLVDRGAGSASLDGVGYLQFIAPGLLAATAMQTATFESTYPVMGAVKWHRTYFGMLATPLRVVDVLAGHLLFVVLRLTITATAFLVVMVVFGAIRSPAALLALPVAVLTGMAYSPAVFALAATIDNDKGFAMLFRFAIMPMFLFSGTFFPVSQLPGWLEPVVWLVPLWHGVDLSRSLALGTVTAGSAALHIAVLLACCAVGIALASRAFTRRLVT